MSAGDTIRIATMRRPIGSHVRFSVAPAKSGCSSMSSGDIRFRPRLKLIRSAAASGSASITTTREKKRRAIAAHRSQTTNLIDDDPGGFLFSQIDLARFDLPYEFFFESDA